MFCPGCADKECQKNAFSQPFDPFAVKNLLPPSSLLPFFADQIKLTQSLRACRVRLTALLSGGAVLEAEEAGLAVVVSVAVLALLLAVDRQAGPESCRRGRIVIFLELGLLTSLKAQDPSH